MIIRQGSADTPRRCGVLRHTMVAIRLGGWPEDSSASGRRRHPDSHRTFITCVPHKIIKIGHQALQIDERLPDGVESVLIILRERRRSIQEFSCARREES